MLQAPEKPKVLLPHPTASQADQHTEEFPTTGLSWKDLHGDQSSHLGLDHDNASVESG
jgi:hypothetical protein